jgi:DNA-binding response OmpR family regulator
MQIRQIVVVEDDWRIADTVRLYLEHDGFAVRIEVDGAQALAACIDRVPDLVILDRMLPSMDGLEVCRRLRLQGEIPIIMLTALTAETDKLHGLQTGADDYVTKPFSPRELVARVHAVLRRSSPRAPRPQRFEHLELDLEGTEAHVDGRTVVLSATEFKLLKTLCRTPGRVWSRARLVESIFGWDYDGGDRTIDVHIANLRRKLARPDLISTVFGAGYKFTGGRIED